MQIKWLKRFLSKTNAKSVCIEILSRPSCYLCEEAKTVLKKVQKEWPFTLLERNIDEDPVLLARFGQEIPVIFVDGKKSFKFHVTEQALKRCIRSAIITREQSHS